MPSSAAAQQKDVTGCRDHALFTRIPGYWIQNCTEKQYDERAFDVGSGKKETIGGPTWTIRYYPQAKTTPASEIQILRNFENAVAKAGGTMLSSPKSRRTFRIGSGEKEAWVELWADFTGKYGFTIVERAAMAQDVVADAAVFSNDLKSTGHTAVCGVYFDTGRAELKPDSEKALEEIGKLLKAEPALRIYVVGHTDNVGSLESNMKLSQARAEAVVQALSRTHGIAAARLQAFGAGPYSPVASNDGEPGRAKNRRVELVKQ